jgi:hypothetical protein
VAESDVHKASKRRGGGVIDAVRDVAHNSSQDPMKPPTRNYPRTILSGLILERSGSVVMPAYVRMSYGDQTAVVLPHDIRIEVKSTQECYQEIIANRFEREECWMQTHEDLQRGMQALARFVVKHELQI